MTPITCGQHKANHADISKSEFIDVNMAEVKFDDVNMSKVTFNNINLSDIEVTAAQIGGAKFKYIGLPPGSKEKQRPVSFEEADLNRSTLTKCNLSEVKIDSCNIEGMKINGLLVTDLLNSYNDSRKNKTPKK